jgi:hypothetical protein
MEKRRRQRRLYLRILLHRLYLDHHFHLRQSLPQINLFRYHLNYLSQLLKFPMQEYPLLSKQKLEYLHWCYTEVDPIQRLIRQISHRYRSLNQLLHSLR